MTLCLKNICEDLKGGEIMDNEDLKEFKPIPGFPGAEVNQLGQVLLDKKERGIRIVNHTPRVRLFDSDNVLKEMSVAKAVALAFLGEGEYSSDVVRFKNGDNTDFRASNLKWMTRSEAYIEDYDSTNPTTKMRLARLHKANCKAIQASIKPGNEFVPIKEYSSITEASEKMCVSVSSITHALRHPNRRAKGYYWRYL